MARKKFYLGDEPKSYPSENKAYIEVCRRRDAYKASGEGASQITVYVEEGGWIRPYENVDFKTF
jgi:hypothetical protein